MALSNRLFLVMCAAAFTVAPPHAFAADKSNEGAHSKARNPAPTPKATPPSNSGPRTVKNADGSTSRIERGVDTRTYPNGIVLKQLVIPTPGVKAQHQRDDVRRADEAALRRKEEEDRNRVMYENTK